LERAEHKKKSPPPRLLSPLTKCVSHMQETCRPKRKGTGEERTRKKEKQREERTGKRKGGKKTARSPTDIEDVQGGDVRGGGAQFIDRLHPDLIRGEEGEVAGDVAGVALLPRAVQHTLLLLPVPPGHKHNGQNKLLYLLRF